MAGKMKPEEVREYAGRELANKPPKKRPLEREPDEMDDEIEDDGPSMDCLPKMRDLLGELYALSLHYKVAHWQASGENFLADHDLFARLDSSTYQGDELAEKMVEAYGNDAVDAKEIAKRMTDCLGKWGGGDAVQTSLKAESSVQECIEHLYEAMDSTEGGLSLGWDNFLQGLADTHDKSLYLLKQRKG